MSPRLDDAAAVRRSRRHSRGRRCPTTPPLPDDHDNAPVPLFDDDAKETPVLLRAMGTEPPPLADIAPVRLFDDTAVGVTVQPCAMFTEPPQLETPPLLGDAATVRRR